jgi:hypothetical protein
MQRLAIVLICGLISVANLRAGTEPTIPVSSDAPRPAQMISLDGGGWFVATDPGNVGRGQQWWLMPRPEAKRTNIPRTLQSVFPGYNGVAWYWRDIHAPLNAHKDGRYWLRFWDVDYYADVWVNGTRVGSHEGLQCPFELDVTSAIKPGSGNRVAVRVIYPGRTPIDGFAFAETAHSWAEMVPSGGILDSVEFIVAPAVRIENLFVIPDLKTGKIGIEVNIRNTGKSAVGGRLALSVCAAAGGGTLGAVNVEKSLASGDTLVKAELAVEDPRLWDINDPYLYRVTARIAAEDSASYDESSTRCGFKDFRFADGFFRLNGRRIFLRSSHTGPWGPVGGVVPYSSESVRRELVACKAMGFNMVRFLARAPLRVQLEAADEIGIMLYDECSASWMFADSPKMGERFDRQLAGMIRRDRNHPSIAMWGLLNETGDGPVFQHAAKRLSLLRSLDTTRPVILASGRFDAGPSYLNGLEIWKPAEAEQPNILFNPNPYAVYQVPLWPSKAVALNPGPGGEYSVVRWTAPAAGVYTISAKFRGTGCYSTTDLHVLHGRIPVYKGFINVRGRGDACTYADTIKLGAGETLDFIVGWAGNLAGSAGLVPWTDTTEVNAVIKSSAGAAYDLAADFSNSKNPNGAWSFGWLKAGPSPDPATFTAYAKCETEKHSFLGGISNPDSNEWEPLLGDLHTYPRVPHRELEIERLRAASMSDQPLFLSEYGVGSGTHWPRILRHYEAMGEESCPSAQSIRDMLAAFMADWNKWKLGDVFAGAEDFFDKCLAKMGGLRKLGINALRSNPRIIGYSMTGTRDSPESYSEGVFTSFREHKPGTFDALADAFAPLRWCLFAEPGSVYRGQKIKLEAVIANEDVLKPGEYPARLQVLGPDDVMVWERDITVKIPAQVGKTETPFVIPVFSEEVPIDGPSGKYRLTARLLKGAAASGENIEFYVTDPRDMPAVKSEIVLWGEDKELASWLAGHGIKTRPFASKTPATREVILVPALPGGAGDAKAWRELAGRIARGSTAVFLSPDVFNKDGNPVGWLPLATKGVLGAISEYTFPQVYVRDEWAKKHPIFEGLPTGLMDYAFYREIIPDYRFAGQETPDEAVAGAFRTSAGYGSELMSAVHKFGSGRFILNALRVRQALGQDPAAERLLRNMLNYAAKDSAKPLVKLPAGFEEQLKAIGYQPEESNTTIRLPPKEALIRPEAR